MMNKTVTLLPCPFCGKELALHARKFNPYARCETGGCKGSRLPVLNLDMPDDIEAWNTRAAQASPVPPARGEVEVLGYQVTRITPTGNARLDRPLLSTVLDGWEPAFKAVELVDRGHVTRLQAELTSANADKAAYAQNAIDLRAEVERLKQVAIDRKDELTKLCTERNDLQAELTKARELLLGSHVKFKYISEGGKFYLSTAAEGMRLIHLAALSNQSAPALVQTLHANGDRIAMEATIAQQAQRIADLEAGEPVVGISDETGFKRVSSDWCERCDAVTQHETRCTGCPECGEEFKSTDKGQGETVHECQKCWGRGVIPTRLSGEGETEYRNRCKVYAEQPAPVAVVIPELVPTFEAWWESDGQYCRAGGGDYEKTFAYRAYENALLKVARLNPIKQ